MRDLEPKLACLTTPEFLTHRNNEGRNANCCFNPLYFEVIEYAI